jgi:sulfate transport system ATP-binding protein
MQVVIFNRGRIEQQGSPNDIIKRPATPFIMKFVGETNMVPASAQVRRVRLSTSAHDRLNGMLMMLHPG